MASEHLARLSKPFGQHPLVGIFHSHRATALSVLGVALALPFAIQDYRTFLSYGPGGLPYNVVGWLAANVARLIAAEQFSTAVYNDPKLPHADQPSFLPASFPPPRTSPRPRIGPHPVPQRQLQQLPSEEVKHKLLDRFAKLGNHVQEKGLVEVRTSRFERHHDAYFVSKTRQWHSVAEAAGGEIAHIHDGKDNSIHVLLHPADCKAVLDAGWGQRHAFSGVNTKRILGFALPVNYVLIYAPRDDAEVDVAIAIVKAAIAFMTGAREDLE